MINQYLHYSVADVTEALAFIILVLQQLIRVQLQISLRFEPITYGVVYYAPYGYVQFAADSSIVKTTI